MEQLHRVPDVAGVKSSGSDVLTNLGKYQVVTQLAVGGMAEILLARSTGLEGFVKHVVIKRILPQYACEERFVSMFIDEARLAACLHHQNIAQVYDIGEDSGDYFFAMEYVHGEDVGTLLDAVRSRGQKVPLPEALTIAAGVAAGLAYAHDRLGPDGEPLGIVHRDVSPSNILVSYEGGVKLVDFGIARASIRNNETRTGGVKGKLSYMSPEQCLGDTLDHRSDIFSLGVVLYELTTCTPLFRDNPDDSDYIVMHRVVKGLVPRPSEQVSEYPAGLEQIVMRALHIEPDNRYQSAGDLLSDIEAFASQERISLSPLSLSRYLASVFGHRREPWRDVAVDTLSGDVSASGSDRDLSVETSATYPQVEGESARAAEQVEEGQLESRTRVLVSGAVALMVLLPLVWVLSVVLDRGSAAVENVSREEVEDNAADVEPVMEPPLGSVGSAPASNAATGTPLDRIAPGGVEPGGVEPGSVEPGGVEPGGAVSSEPVEHSAVPGQTRPVSKKATHRRAAGKQKNRKRSRPAKRKRTKSPQPRAKQPSNRMQELIDTHW